MADNPSTTSIEVDLQLVHTGRAFDRSGSFFQRELDQALEIVLRLGERAAKERCRNRDGTYNENILHSHDCISVFGRRGVGKTSFILSLGKLVENDNKSIDSARQPKCRIAVLPPIDPTMMEDTDTFLSLVIANVLQYVEEKLHNRDWPEDLNNCLSDLGNKIGVLAPASVYEAQWKEMLLDTDSYTYEILRKARSGIGLAKSVNRFLLASAKACDVDAFMQGIDDVDTAVHRGWPVLETLRKYLSSPFLITVLTGDAQLFDAMVGQQKLKSLDAAIKLENTVKMPSNNGKITRSLVDHLVDQYLMKVMPPHQRIVLPIVAEEIIEASLRNKEYVRVKNRNMKYNREQTASQPDDFSELFRLLTKEILHFPNSMNYEDIKPLDCFKPEIGDFLSKLIPRFTRSLIQFMEMLETHKEELESHANDRDLLFEQLMHVFEITLTRRGILMRDMERLWHNDHIEWLTKFCLEVREEAPMLWSMDRNYDDVGWSQRLLLLQAALLQGWKRCADIDGQQHRLLNPAGPMSYMIKTCIPCWIADELQLTKNQVSELKNLTRIGTSKDHVEIASLSLAYLLRDKELQKHDILCLMPAIYWSRETAEIHLHSLRTHNFNDHKTTKFYHPGFLPWWKELSEKNLFAQTKDHTDHWKHYLPDLNMFSEIAGPQGNFVARWFGFFRYQSAQSNLQFYISPIIGFARIIDLITNLPQLSMNDNVHYATSDTTNFIQELISVRPCEITPNKLTAKQQATNDNKKPAKNKNTTNVFTAPLPYPTAHDVNSDTVKAWANVLTEWQKSLSVIEPHDVLPPRVISRVFLKFLNQLKIINSTANHPESTWSAGQFLEQWVCCFVNALIAEELSHQIYKMKRHSELAIYYDNTPSVIDALTKNLNILQSSDVENLGAFSRKWLACPLFLAVVRKQIRDEMAKAARIQNYHDDDFYCVKLPNSNDHPVDIHTLLCSLMPQPDESPSPENINNVLEICKSLGYPIHTSTLKKSKTAESSNDAQNAPESADHSDEHNQTDSK